MRHPVDAPAGGFEDLDQARRLSDTVVGSVEDNDPADGLGDGGPVVGQCFSCMYRHGV